MTSQKTKQVKQDILNQWESTGFPERMSLQLSLHLCSYLWEAAIQENFQNEAAPRSSYQDAFFNMAFLHL